MATLSEAQRNALHALIMRLLSARWHQIDLTKAQLRAAVALFDDALEDCEANILSAVSPEARNWLVANQQLARYVLEQVAIARRKEL